MHRGFTRSQLYVGRRALTALGGGGGSYVSPYLFEALHSGTFGAQVATGTLTANTGQNIPCSRTSSAYCLGNDGLLHLLGANTVRVEPAGLLIEGTRTNGVQNSVNVGGTNWNVLGNTLAAPTVTLNSTDVTDPAGGNEASKVVFPASAGAGFSILQCPPNNGANGTGLAGAYTVYARTLSGNVTLNIQPQTGTAGDYQQFTVTPTWQRLTFIEPTSSPWFDIGYINDGSGAPDMSGGTVYLWLAQWENGAKFPSSPIRTSTGAASRIADLINPANPLFGLNPGTWRMGCTITPMTTWLNMFALDGVSVFMDIGTNTGANTSRLLIQSTPQAEFHVVDNSTTDLGLTLPGSFGAVQSTVQFLCLTTAGVLTGLPAGGSTSGSGTGTITTQPSLLGLGHSTDLAAFGVWGHMTDILVHNA